MKQIKEQIHKIIYAKNIASIQSLFRIGFELEFDGINGDACETEFDFESAREAWRDQLETDDLCRECDDFDNLNNAANTLNVSVYELIDRLPNSLGNRAQRILETAEERNWDTWAENNAGEYQRSNRDNLDIPALCEIVDDSSVNGGEIRPTRPLKVSEYMRTIRMLPLDELDINTGCSFHIHLSVEGVQHYYGKLLQSEMTAYILKSQIAKNDALKDRWQSNAMSYFKPERKHDKYTFVNFNGKYSTWEFRCFGNISDTETMKKALLTAMKALQHAYRVKYKLAEPIVEPTISDYNFNDTCLKAMNTAYAGEDVFKKANEIHAQIAVGG